MPRAPPSGGFILPNDHVDVVRTYRDDEATKATGSDVVTQTILSNVRVLAIGQNVQNKNGEAVVVGSNATLELDRK
ncbi:MAG TPA: RcpC/CpaB family pilus assembly protein [Beijerinckiaceae bacterium]|nr:RcpC/CpaB family pilus assembly protein [Beijerinckiaceae bacterium]